MTEINIMKMKIEKLNKTQQLDILKILIENSIEFTENSNGIFLNLSILEPQFLAKIEKYINYTYDQEKNLSELEKKKDDYKKEFFNLT